MRTAMPWSLIGKTTTLIVAWTIAFTVSAIAELYWPEMYEFIFEGAVGVVLYWAIFWRGRAS